MKRVGLLLVILLIAGSVAVVQGRTADGLSQADHEAITATALDYIEGWYTGDAERMERALHPELSKRIVAADRNTGKNRLQNMTAEQLVQATGAGYGKSVPEDERQRDVTVLDVFGNAACVKIVARDWIDYLHVGKVDGEWKIINVLWETKPSG